MALKRKTPLRSPKKILNAVSLNSLETIVRSKRLKPISDKRKKELAVYRRAKEDFLSARVCCHSCDRPKKLDIHHAAGRIGLRLLDERYWIPLCRKCHDEVRRDPAWAVREGFIVRNPLPLEIIA